MDPITITATMMLAAATLIGIRIIRNKMDDSNGPRCA